MSSAEVCRQSSPTSVNYLAAPRRNQMMSYTNLGQAATTPGSLVAQRALQFGGLHSSLVTPRPTPMTESATFVAENSVKKLCLGDKTTATNAGMVTASDVAPSTTAPPNELGSIMEISKAFAELHIPVPTSPKTPKGGEIPSATTEGRSIGVRALRKIKSLNSVLNRKGSGQPDDAPRRTLSSPGRLTKALRVAKESARKALKKVVSRTRLRR